MNWTCSCLIVFTLIAGTSNSLLAQDTPAPPPARSIETDVTTSADQKQAPAVKTVAVKRTATDEEIAARLNGILEATRWFQNGKVEVQDGVAFLDGTTHDAKYKDWATQLAEKTDDVVAVVNRISIPPREWWNLAPAWEQIRTIGHKTIQTLPIVAIALTVLLITWGVARWVAYIAGRMIERRVSNRILQQVGSRVAMIPVFIIGIYIALAIGGLTQVAATIVGGTGLLGLIVGIAFRDIAENFLASILISMQRPFELGDQIEVTGITGIVQSVTTRGTTVMTLDGNSVQIPNSIIYKNTISNFTSNPRLRLSFPMPISKETNIEDAQSAIVEILNQHEAICPEPPPVVLVDDVAAAVTTLRVLCWIDGRKYSAERVRSALLRLSANAIRDLPQSHGETKNQRLGHKAAQSTPPAEAEGNLENECQELEKHGKEDARPESGTNLLTPEKQCPQKVTADLPQR